MLSAEPSGAAAEVPEVGSNEPGRERNPALRRFQSNVAVEAYAGGTVRVRVNDGENPCAGRDRDVKVVDRFIRHDSGRPHGRFVIVISQQICHELDFTARPEIPATSKGRESGDPPGSGCLWGCGMLYIVYSFNA